MKHYFTDLISHPGVYAIAGMAGIFSATVRAPLTGLVLAIEMTSNYELILPLIVTTVIASVSVSYTDLTLPTTYAVQNPAVAVPLKKTSVHISR